MEVNRDVFEALGAGEFALEFAGPGGVAEEEAIAQVGPFLGRSSLARQLKADGVALEDGTQAGEAGGDVASDPKA